MGLTRMQEQAGPPMVEGMRDGVKEAIWKIHPCKYRLYSGTWSV